MDRQNNNMELSIPDEGQRQLVVPRGSYSHLPVDAQQQLCEIDTAIERVLETIVEAPAREKYKLFVEFYLGNGFNGTRAYESAGYEAKTYESKQVGASKLLKKLPVEALVALALRKLHIHENFQLHQQKSIRELNRLAYSNIADVVETDVDGEVSIRDLSALPDDVTAAIQHISCTKKLIPQQDGDPIEETKMDVRMHKKPIETLLRGTKVIGEKGEQKATVINFNLNFGGGYNGLPTDGGLTGNVIDGEAQRVG